MEEVIRWTHVDDDRPDDGITMLLNAPESSYQVWPGYLDAGEWRWADGSLVKEDVVAWAEMPVGLEAANYETLDR